MSRPPPARRGGALFVAAGILLSRLFGLVRQRVFGHYLGTSDAADAYSAAFKIPNFLQNLLGEGVLSASFIPVYARLRARSGFSAEENERDARRLASAVAGLLGLATGLLCLLGLAATPWLIDAIAPGFTGGKRLLAIQLVQIFFPGIALLVLAAFCIGVLNSHGRFFLGYAAPVLWSLAQIAALLFGDRADPGNAPALARWAAWGSVVGSALQLGVQVPSVLRVLGGLRREGLWPTLGRGDAHVGEVVRSFLPVVAGRGVVQLSAYLDSFIASWLPTGAVAALAYAQTIYLLPVSLFAMSISAAALPAMSAAQGQAGEGGERSEAAREALRSQLAAGLRTLAYPVVPSAVVLLALGDVACAALFRTGRFGADQVLYVALILSGSSVGLLGATQARLYASALFALRDPRTPFWCSSVRVAVTGLLGLLCGLWLPRALGVDPELGAAGLTATAGVAGWVEFLLLRGAVVRRIGPVGLPARLTLQLWGAAALAGAAAVLLRAALDALASGPSPALPGFPSWLLPIARAAVVLGGFGLVYFGATAALGVPEARGLARRLRIVRG
jgi:putative peptidoglycan lipid II flippase